MSWAKLGVQDVGEPPRCTGAGSSEAGSKGAGREVMSLFAIARAEISSSSSHARRLTRCLALLPIIMALGALSAHAAADDVLTQHNDAARTGAQLHETSLKPGNVSATTFGRLYERHVDGQIIAQPLYAGNLDIPGKGPRNVVFVATRKNVVYAFDADDLDPDPTHGLVWSQPVTVEPAAPVPGMCGETYGPIGINSTPVIDRA